MEISNEIKAKIFAQYLGQKCYRGGTPDEVITLVMFQNEKIAAVGFADGDEYVPNKYFDSLQLILKPLSEISDEDAIEAANTFGKGKWSVEIKSDYWRCVKDTDSNNEVRIMMSGCISYWRVYLTSEQLNDSCSLQAYQFLQSKGYDLPNYLLGGKTLKECNLAIYE